MKQSAALSWQIKAHVWNVRLHWEDGLHTLLLPMPHHRRDDGPQRLLGYDPKGRNHLVEPRIRAPRQARAHGLVARLRSGRVRG